MSSGAPGSGQAGTAGTLPATTPHERRRIASGSPYESRIGFSRAVGVDGRVVVSGTAPVWPDGSCDPDPHAQARRCEAQP